MKKLKYLNSILKLLFLTTMLGTVNTSHAISIGLTLSSDLDPLTLSTGDQITFTVGITEETKISGYTLDIRFDSMELAFVSSEQLVPFFEGLFIPPYLLDPAITAGDAGSSGLASSESGRVAVLTTSNSSPVGDLFSLTFDVHGLINDGLDDLVVGVLDIRADDINPAVGEVPFTFDANVVSVQVSAVPVPAAVWLFGSSLIGLMTARKKQKTV